MANEKPRVNQQFLQQLNQDQFPVSDIMQSADKTGVPLARVLRKWTNYSNAQIRDGMYQVDRDNLLPQIEEALTLILKSWIQSELDDLPSIQIVELARITGISSEKVISILMKYPVSIVIKGIQFVSKINLPDLLTELTIVKSRQFRLSPKRIARSTRYQSRPPGGGPVQKARIDTSRLNGIIRKAAVQRAQVVFENTQEIDPEIKVMEELITPVQSVETIEEIVYAEPNGQQIMDIIKWFQSSGFGKDWIIGDNATLFAKNLVKLSRGETVNFIIWNCIGFKWFQNSHGQFPTCDITHNLDAAITPYFQEKIFQIAQVLSTLGQPEISILVPTNEAFDNNVWIYRQTEEEREQIINQTVQGLSQTFTSVNLPGNCMFQVKRWDDFVHGKKVLNSPNIYSQQGEKRVRESPKVKRILREAVRSGRSYLKQNGIVGIDDRVLAQRQIKYYGVYAGEGVVFQELQERGEGVVVINFEEMRVPQMAMYGAKGNLAIVTPITAQEMTEFYQWEQRQVQKRA